MIKHGEQNRNKVFKCELFKNAIIMLGHIQYIMFKYVLTKKCVAYKDKLKTLSLNFSTFYQIISLILRCTKMHGDIDTVGQSINVLLALIKQYGSILYVSYNNNLEMGIIISICR